MAENSKIQWTDNTANFWWGCFKVSAGCTNCYADTWASRWGKDIWGPAKTTDRELKKGVWSDVRKWNKRAAASGKREKVFCMSMGDFFEDHEQVLETRLHAFDLIEESINLDWQLLTKRPENVMRMVPDSWHYDWPAHVWIGTSVENQEQADKRIPELLKIPAAVRFLSCEPLLGPVDFVNIPHPALKKMSETEMAYEFLNALLGISRLPKINWVIVGGESGPNARPMHPDWARSIRDQCVAAGVAFHFKQWGEWLPGTQLRADGTNGQLHQAAIEAFGGKSDRVFVFDDETRVHKVGKHGSGRMLDGREWNEFPRVAQVV